MSYDWESVESSNVAAVKYNDKTRILDVKFKNGSIYEYTGVVPGVGNALPYMESKGKAVWELLRKPGVPYKRIA